MHAAPTTDEATTRWMRLEVDTDNTIPVELYSRPYERIEVEDPPAPAPAPAPAAAPGPGRIVVALFCIAAFFGGFSLVVLLGCSNAKKDPPPASGSGMIVQPRFSGGNEAPSDEGRAPFTITAVHARQKPSTTAPFYEAGGDWTYVEAHLDGDPAATFVVGVPKLGNTDGGPAFGKLMFAPTTREAGARVVDRLGKVLRTSAPPPTSGGVLQAVKVPIAVLGHGIGKLDNGLGGSGTWDATKLFCSSAGIDSAELFFNLSIADKQGEFSEKDADYNKDVVACLATVLRDGLPPPRTPANDATLAAAGPRLDLGKKIGNRRMQELALSPARLLMIDERGDSAAVVEVDVKTGATKDLFTTPDRIESGDCDPALVRCVLRLSTPKEERNVFGNDPSRLMFLDGATATALAVGTIEKPNLTTASLSPDGRFVVAMSYNPTKLVALDRTTKRTFELAGADKESIDVMAWDGTTAIVVRSSYDEGKQPVVLEWQLGAKGATKPSKRAIEAPPVSPDGTRRATFANGALTLTAGDKTRTLAFHPDDARAISPGCCAWLDNRWMSMRGGFIDTDAMKVSLLPQDADAEPPRIEYVLGTRIAVVFRDDAVYLATVVGP